LWAEETVGGGFSVHDAVICENGVICVCGVPTNEKNCKNKQGDLSIILLHVWRQMNNTEKEDRNTMLFNRVERNPKLHSCAVAKLMLCVTILLEKANE
jgi:hypothetical protein